MNFKDDQHDVHTSRTTVYLREDTSKFFKTCTVSHLFCTGKIAFGNCVSTLFTSRLKMIQKSQMRHCSSVRSRKDFDHPWEWSCHNKPAETLWCFPFDVWLNLCVGSFISKRDGQHIWVDSEGSFGSWWWQTQAKGAGSKECLLIHTQ